MHGLFSRMGISLNTGQKKRIKIMKKNIIKVCLIVQVICVLLFLIDVICLGKDTFCYFIQQVEIVGAVLTCWVWGYYLAKLISFCANDSKVGRFLLWSISVIVFFIFLIT